ncbi:MAG: hypothetical protein ACE5GE_08675, partial [Phycisphaerae bacterium]
MAATATAQDPCLVLDDGTGTVDLPPPGCDYLSPDEVHEIIDGLPPGTTIKLAPIHNEFICRQGGGGPHCGTPGGSLGGDVENFDSFMQLRLQGTGPLAPFVRRLTIPILCQTHTGPRTAGDPVQTFPTTMWSLQGSLVGDPDFAQLNIRAGDAFGLPSPGQTTLTDLGNGNWQVDSFFDITYEIDYVGAPGGALAGLAGTTQATLRMQASAGAIPPPCGPLADQSACNSGICQVLDQCVPIAMNWVPGGPQLVTDCSCQDPTLCHVDFGPVSPICVGSCPPGQVCQIFSADFDGDGIDEAWACDCVQSTGCGDGQCIAPEDQCNCPVDCGTPPAIETSCTDGVDNDCDTLIDCLDPDCANDPACGPVPCDVSDPATCSGFCPPDEVCTPDPLGPCKCVPVPCAQSDPATCGGSCPAGGGICLPGPAGTACSCQHCGDGVCDATVGEDQCSCPIDCGTPPATETSCTDGVDNDCDTLIDCLDPDCANDPACGPVPCAQSDPAICNGTCPPDEVCTPTPALCVCLPVPCDQSDPATCGGSCPPDQVCTLDALGQCTCVPVPCPQSDPATCGGSCPPGTGVCLPGAAGIACSCQTCGDGICDPIIGEDQCTCPVDCGTPPGNEVPNLTCQDGLDNDCDNLIDCLDPDCANDPACQPNVCPEPGGFPGPCANLQTTDCQSTAAGTCLPKCVNYIPGTTIVQATQCGCIDPAECHVVMPVAPGARVPNPCEVIDAGGTVQLPPIGCDYLTADEVHLILNDLPAGTTIELDPIHTPIFCKQGPGTSGFPGCPPPGICEQPGGALGGNVDCFDSTLQLTVSGTGTLG